MSNIKEKRNSYPMCERAMYKLNNINQFIEKERRQDELDRLLEVRQQKKVWKTVVFIAGSIILILLFLAYRGYMQNV
ncbi:MAG TPA: hypothetical protein DCL21_07435 [Alphaproteobacteria bacterium]|nr:hypothetical protein [Alphaproteobacteria bacterium]